MPKLPVAMGDPIDTYICDTDGPVEMANDNQIVIKFDNLDFEVVSFNYESMEDILAGVHSFDMMGMLEVVHAYIAGKDQEGAMIIESLFEFSEGHDSPQLNIVDLEGFKNIVSEKMLNAPIIRPDQVFDNEITWEEQ